LGGLDELFASRVKILGGPSMAWSQANGNDIEREPNTNIMKDQVVILENIVQQMTNIMCEHGEKVKNMEAKICRRKHGFNEVIRECQETTNVHDRFKEVEDALA
jgi:hypothetical protein